MTQQMIGQNDTINSNLDNMTYFNPATNTVGYWIENGQGGDFYTTSGEYHGYYDSGDLEFHLFDADGIEIGFGEAGDFESGRNLLTRQLAIFERDGILPEDFTDVISDGQGGYVVREYVNGFPCEFAYQEDITEGEDLVLVGSSNQVCNYQDDTESLRVLLSDVRASKPQWSKEMKGLFVANFGGNTLTVEKDQTTQMWQGQAFKFYPEIDDEIVQFSQYAHTKEDAMSILNTYALS